MYGYYNSYWERLLNRRSDWERKKYRRYVLGAIFGGYYVTRYEYHVVLIYCYASVPVVTDSYKPP